MYQLLSLGVWLQESHNLILQAGGGPLPCVLTTYTLLGCRLCRAIEAQALTS